MPVHRHPKRLLQTSYSATGHRARSGTVLLGKAVIEINLGVRADTAPEIPADQPVVKSRLGKAGARQTLVQRVAAIDRPGPGSRELVVRGANEGVADRADKHTGTRG